MSYCLHDRLSACSILLCTSVLESKANNYETYFVDSFPVALSNVETFMSAYTTCRNSTYKSHPIQTYKLRNTCGFLVGGDVETGVLYCVSL